MLPLTRPSPTATSSSQGLCLAPTRPGRGSETSKVTGTIFGSSRDQVKNTTRPPVRPPWAYDSMIAGHCRAGGRSLISYASFSPISPYPCPDGPAAWTRPSIGGRRATPLSLENSSYSPKPPHGGRTRTRKRFLSINPSPLALWDQILLASDIRGRQIPAPLGKNHFFQDRGRLLPPIFS